MYPYVGQCSVLWVRQSVERLTLFKCKALCFSAVYCLYKIIRMMERSVPFRSVLFCSLFSVLFSVPSAVGVLRAGRNEAVAP